MMQSALMGKSTPTTQIYYKIDYQFKHDSDVHRLLIILDELGESNKIVSENQVRETLNSVYKSKRAKTKINKIMDTIHAITNEESLTVINILKVMAVNRCSFISIKLVSDQLNSLN